MKTVVKFVIAVFIFFSGYSLKAQNLKYDGGVHGGLTITEFALTGQNTFGGERIYGKGILGFEAGIYGKVMYNYLYVKPMALLGYSQGSVDVTLYDGTFTNQDFSTGRLLIPVLFGYNLMDGPLSIEAGPVWNYVFSEQIIDVRDIEAAPSGFGYRAGLNLEYNRLFFGVHYQNLYNRVAAVAGDYDLDMRNEVIVNVGLRLGSAKDMMR